MKQIGAAAGVAAGQGLLGEMLVAGDAAAQVAVAPRPAYRRAIRSIYLSQVGYLPAARKMATVILEEPIEGDAKAAELPSPCAFTVHAAEPAASGAAPVLTGVLTAPVFDPLSGDHVCAADLSALTAPGRYRITADGVTGDVFTIDPHVYAHPLRLAMRFYYGQRCGMKVDLGGGYKHDLCHLDCEYGASSGRTGKLKNTGGWHDAGDYGRYVVNSGITCGTLLWAWEMFPHALGGLALDLPESGRGVPDFLAEVRWNLNWMLSMQDESDGGVWHKQTSADFCGFIMPEKDKLPSEVIGTGSEPYKSTDATGDFAAVMAIAARCYKAYDATFAARCLAAARKAYTWCEAHPRVYFSNPPGVLTGEYGSQRSDGERLWAAAELFRTTREDAYQNAVRAQLQPLLITLRMDAPSWGNVMPLGLWTYAMAQPETDAAGSAIRQATQKAALSLLVREAQSGFGNTMAGRDYHWGSNSEAANQSLLLLVSHHFNPSLDVVEAALGNLHYLLGRNCFGICWVTQLGVRPLLHPHHRPSFADGLPDPWPGMLAGGPNSHGGDTFADHLPQAAPMRSWGDDVRAFSLNEVAINWNAPLVFLLAAAVNGL